MLTIFGDTNGEVYRAQFDQVELDVNYDGLPHLTLEISRCILLPPKLKVLWLGRMVFQDLNLLKMSCSGLARSASRHEYLVEKHMVTKPRLELWCGMEPWIWCTECQDVCDHCREVKRRLSDMSADIRQWIVEKFEGNKASLGEWAIPALGAGVKLGGNNVRWL